MKLPRGDIEWAVECWRPGDRRVSLERKRPCPRERGEGLGRPPKDTEEQPHPAPLGATGGARPGVSGRRERSAVPAAHRL